MGRDHAVECEHCGASYGGLYGPDECDCTGRIVNLVLHCPKCGTLHLDVGEWRDRPHKTHLCLNEKCGHLWRPVEAHTRGVSVEEATAGDLVDSLFLTCSTDELRAVLACGRCTCGHLNSLHHYGGGDYYCDVSGCECAT